MKNQESIFERLARERNITVEKMKAIILWYAFTVIKWIADFLTALCLITGGL